MTGKCWHCSCWGSQRLPLVTSQRPRRRGRTEANWISRRRWTATLGLGVLMAAGGPAAPMVHAFVPVYTHGAPRRQSGPLAAGGTVTGVLWGRGIKLPPAPREPTPNWGRTAPSRSVLTGVEEAELAGWVRDASGLAAAWRLARNELGRNPTDDEWGAAAGGLTAGELRRCLRRAKEAKARIVAANLGLVAAVARRFCGAHWRRGRSMPWQDVLQEGTLGLIAAAERFDPERGFRFSTYATWWIRQKIQKAITDQSRMIRLPAHVHDFLALMRKSAMLLQVDLGREPTQEELACYLNVSLKKVQQYANSPQQVTSLETPGSAVPGSRRLRDGLAAEGPSPEDEIEAGLMQQELEQIMNMLAPMERDVLVLRYGLADGTPRTIGEVGLTINVSKDRVRNVEARALNKLRQPSRNYRLRRHVM